MRSYECTVVFNPGMNDESVKTSLARYAELIAANGGENTAIETWGKRRLAYEIEHHSEGHYFFYRFRGENDVLKELSRQMRIDENILRHMLVVDELATGTEAKVEPSALEPSAPQPFEEVKDGPSYKEEKR